MIKQGKLSCDLASPSRQSKAVRTDLLLFELVTGGNILPLALVYSLSVSTFTAPSPGAGDLGFVIPMPRYACPGGCPSLRGFFYPAMPSDLKKEMSSRLTTRASGALVIAERLAD